MSLFRRETFCFRNVWMFLYALDDIRTINVRLKLDRIGFLTYQIQCEGDAKSLNRFHHQPNYAFCHPTTFGTPFILYYLIMLHACPP